MLGCIGVVVTAVFSTNEMSSLLRGGLTDRCLDR